MSIDIFDPLAPLESIKGETKRANHAARTYILMGPGRTIKQVRDRLNAELNSDLIPGKIKNAKYASNATFGVWSSRFQWVARAAAYDLTEDRIRADLWQKRREEIREKDFAAANELRDLAASIISAAPNFIRSTRRRVKGETRIGANGSEIKDPDMILVTTALDGDLLVKLLDLASKLQRAAAGIANNNFVFPVEMGNLSDDQLAAIAAGENPIEVLSRGRSADDAL